MFRFGGPAFRDRREAGRRLAGELTPFAGRDDVVVVALPRGGVPVGSEVAAALGAPLTLLVVRKLGAPGNPELAIGALASDGTLVVDRDLIEELAVSEEYLDGEIAAQQAEIERRTSAYGQESVKPDVAGKTVILVDDGVATGSTIEAGLAALRESDPAELVAAVPVGSRDVLDRLGGMADRVVCVEKPDMVFGVGAWYDDFTQTTEREVRRALSKHGSGAVG